MVTKNYWLYKEYADSHPITSFSQCDQVNFGIKDATGDSSVSVVWGPSADFQTVSYTRGISNQRIFANLDIVLGTGNTTATADDYCLESDVTSALSNYEQSVSVSADALGVDIIITVSGRNANINAITIREIGVYKKFYDRTQAYGGGTLITDHTNKTLYIRHVLDSPRTVTPNESFSLSFRWREQ